MPLDPPIDYFCDTCNVVVAGRDAEQIRVGTGSMAVCRTCRRALTPTPGRVVAAPGASPSFPRVLAGAFAYPFRLSILAVVAGLAVVTTLLGFAALTRALGYSMELALLFHIVRITADGQDDWALGSDEGSTVVDWLRPLGRYLGSLVVAAAPAIAVWFGTQSPALTLAAAALGLAYLPAAFVAASYASGGCLGALNPLPAIALIARIPGPYVITLGFLAIGAALSFGVVTGVEAMARALDGVPIVPSLVGRAAQMLVPLMMARMLGLLVREHSEEVFGS